MRVMEEEGNSSQGIEDTEVTGTGADDTVWLPDDKFAG